jgi:hypothetical protein
MSEVDFLKKRLWEKFPVSIYINIYGKIAHQSSNNNNNNNVSFLKLNEIQKLVIRQSLAYSYAI